ncbi:MAG: cytochrome P450 [Deltaproteobacteria bacterium]|nr:MAG: cytochrome P450 [Deltaproteobacteria bacterium]
MSIDHVNLADPDAFVGGVPHEVFTRLRAEAPIYWHPESDGPGFWVLSRYHDVTAVSLDPKTFSSWKGGTIIRDWKGQDLEQNRLMMLNMDAPRHTKYRRLVTLGFTPRMVTRLTPHVRAMANRIIDNVAARGACDFVTEIAAELPLQAIAEMIGVPLEDRHLVFDWSNRMIGFDDPDYSGSAEAGKLAAVEMYLYANQLALARKEHPRDDLVSVISGGMLALMQHPEERRRLLANPALLPTAIEEMLRWVTPVMYFRRTATHDTEIRGQKIHEGEKVTLWYISANRDEEIFPHPDRFDVGRNPNDHLAFGIGHHFCLGANLARLEIQIMFEELLRRLPDIELAGPVARLRSNFINGIKSMPVRFTPERRAGRDDAHPHL